MAIKTLSFGMQSEPGRYGSDNPTRLINAYRERAGASAENEWSIYACDGLRDYATLTNGGACRGLLRVDDTLVAVSGQQVFTVGPTGDVTNVGGFAGSAPVRMAHNRRSPDRETVLVSEGQRKLLVAGVLSNITDGDLPPPIDVAFVDGYILYLIDDGRVFFSGIENAAAINALDFFTAEGSSDKGVGLVTRRREVFVFGETSTEIWINTGDATAPFARQAFIERGCLARSPVLRVEDAIAWVADDRTVRLAPGYDGERISTHAVERSIVSADPADLSALTYSLNGHTWYVLNGTGFTWAYDLTTGLWHEQESYGLNRRRWSLAATHRGKVITGDYSTGKLYEISQTALDDAGTKLVMRLVSPQLSAYPNRVICNRVTLNAVPGVGLNTDDAHEADPQVVIRISKDGGKTFGTQRAMSIGEIGAFNVRARSQRLGMSREDGFVFEVSASSSVVRALTNASVDFDVVSA